MKNRRKLLIGLIAGTFFALVLIFVFFTGVLVGRRGEDRFFPFWERRHVFGDYVPNKLDGHGVVGTVDSLSTNTLVVKDRTGALKTVLVDNETKIRRGHMPTNFSDLKTGEKVIILGEPQEQEGAIKAKIIRVFEDFRKESTSSQKW